MLGCIIKNKLTIREINTIRVFRKVRSRISLVDLKQIENLQYSLTAQRIGLHSSDIKKTINTWIYEKPLRFIPKCKYPHLDEFISDINKNGLKIGFFSDYPAKKKLKVLGVESDAIVCSTDKDVDRFKPHPKGLFVASQRLNVNISDCIFIGDRQEKDGLCARRAGIPFINIKTYGRSPYSNKKLYEDIDRWINS